MQLRSVRTRERIIIATARAINDRSYERASPARIAAEADVTTGAFYFHFRSKEQAARAVINIQDAYSQARAAEIAAGDSPTLQLMLETSAMLMRDIVQDPVVRAGIRLAAEIGLLGTFPTQNWQGWIDNNVVQLAAAVEEGALRPDTDIGGVSELIVASIGGVFLLCSMEREMTVLLPRIHQMWQQFLRANATDPNRWLPTAERLFAIPAPDPLTLEQILHRHREGIAIDLEASAEENEPAATRGA